MPNTKNVKPSPLKSAVIFTFGSALGESDTYEVTSRKEKEHISENAIKRHWDLRAQRKGLQAVLSSLHSPADNARADANFKRDVFEFLDGLVEAKNVFELGVGIGRMTVELAKRARMVAGCDISPHMLEAAKKHLRPFHNVKLYEGSLLDIPLPKRRFDLVFETIVLLHILNSDVLKAVVERMRLFSDTIFIAEPIDQGQSVPISKYSVLRTEREYIDLFRPYALLRKKVHFFNGDPHVLMIFKNP